MSEFGQVLFCVFYGPKRSRGLVYKGFIVLPKKEPFSWGTNAGNPERVRWTHFALPGSQSEYRFRGFSYVIREIASNKMIGLMTCFT